MSNKGKLTKNELSKTAFCTIIFVLGTAGPLLGFLGRWNWFFDLFNHFRVQFTVILLIAAALLCLGKAFKKATFSILLLAYCVSSIAPYFLIGNLAHENPARPLKIFYANVYTANHDHSRLGDAIKTKNPDALIFLEINQRWKNYLETELNDFKYRELIPREDNFGIAVFSKIPMTITTEYAGSAEVPSLRCEFMLDGRKVVLWATHPLPPVGKVYWMHRNEQLKEISRRLSDEQKPTLLIGDLNTTPWTHWFKTVTENRLKDSRVGFGLQPSWPSMWPVFLRIPIDHLLYTREFSIAKRQVLDDIGSDHFPLYAEVFLK